MLLINTQSLDLEEFSFGYAAPRYAILSHTWGAEEVSLQEWHSRYRVAAKAGYKKIFSACQQARADGLEYLWVDTNCIDKKSSAELSEAINSMFAFYANSDRCYVYLADFLGPDTSRDTKNIKHAESGEPSEMQELQRCRWFTRGWTLQELLAPRVVIFFDSKWRKVGEKQNALFCDQLSRITGINNRHLESRHSVFTASVAERMSWAARRQTTREEDIAYCMLGIFGINMPLLYGEGSRAFLRLQEEIIRISDDQTIFCWNYPKGARFFNAWHSVLASHPNVFAESGNFIPTPSDDTYYSLTNNGLSIKLQGVLIDQIHTFALLKAAVVDHGHYQVALILRKQGSQHGRNPQERLRRIPGQIATEILPLLPFRLSYRAVPEWAQPNMHMSLPHPQSFLVLLPCDNFELYIAPQDQYSSLYHSLKRMMGRDTDSVRDRLTTHTIGCLLLTDDQTEFLGETHFDVLAVDGRMVTTLSEVPFNSANEIIREVEARLPRSFMPPWLHAYIIDYDENDVFVLAGFLSF